MISLVLSGGSAWGLAHIGVIEVLQENDIGFDLIVGTSAGAIVGALFAAGVSTDEMRSLGRNLSWSSLGDLTLPRLGVFDSSDIQKVLEECIGAHPTFDNLQTDLRVVAADISTGERVVFSEGPVAFAVRASASIPVVFAPVEYEDMLLLDGGLVDNLPVDVALEAGAERIIAVQLSDYPAQRRPGNMVEVAHRALMIMQRARMKEAAASADVLIRPRLKGVSPTDLDADEVLIEQGRRAATAHLDKIRKVVADA